MSPLRSTLLLLFLLPQFSFGQAIPELAPQLGTLIDKSSEGEQQFNRDQKACELVWEKMAEQSYEDLTVEEQRLFDSCDESYESYWEILGAGCSWYCGGGPDSVSSSSELKGKDTISYAAQNAHDLSYATAWVEGVEGYGVGESLTYYFNPASPRITEIIVVNGYVKSDQAWRDNSRVKKLRVSVDGTPIAVLDLVDTKAEQHFKIGPLGNGDRDDWKVLQSLPEWTLTFEILDVYRGDKFDDTAITEIYFDGIDVH